jgi:LCP family protein required for cell wall assembly
LRTTLKRGIGRAAVNGNGNGHAVLPSGALTPMARYRQPEPPKRGVGRRFVGLLGWLAVVALMLAGGAVGGLYLYGHDFANATAPHSIAMRRAAKQLDFVSPDKPAVALVMGTDHRYVDGKDPGRSDTLMLIRTDPSTKTVSMLSFPRDLQTEIHCPGRGTWVDKINAAYATCGPSGPLETVKALTNVPVNYLISVNFVGFIQVVNKLGGVYMDVDRRYFNNHTGPTGYASINLQPGYQRLSGKEALDFVRYRHTDSDLYRVARQQMFVRAAKEQVARFSRFHVLHLLKSIKENVEIGRGGGSGVDFSTMLNYALFFHGLPGGHFVQVRIQGIEQPFGSTNLTTAPQNIADAVQAFLNPDPEAPARANAAALKEKYRPKAHGMNPKGIFITVLNGNGVSGSAAVSSSQLGQRGYQMLQPPSSLRADAPDGWNHDRTRIFFDPEQAHSKAAAEQVAKLFSITSIGPLTPRFHPYANGAMLVVVVGKSYTGSLVGASASAPAPKHQPPHITAAPSAVRLAMSGVRRSLPFRLEYPTKIDRSSALDFEQPNPRAYSIQGHKAVRLVFYTGTPGEYWGIEETNWSGAPALSEKNFVRHFGPRTFEFFYSGSHLHMIVLKEGGATYWVVNTLVDSLSNETMIAIARSLRPLR